MKKITRTVATICMLALVNIPYTIGKTNGSGIGKTVYYTPAANIDAWPTITDDLDDAANVAGYIGYTGSFTLAPGKYFIKCYNVQGEGSVTAEAIGERDSKMFENHLSIRFPKMTDEVMTFVNAVVNGDGVFVVWHDGAWRVIGNENYRCDVTPNVTSGDAAGSSKGVTIEAVCPDYKALPKYSGDIVMQPDAGDEVNDYYTLNCSTGVITKHAKAA